MNLNELSNYELDILRRDVEFEQKRRKTLASAPAQADEIARRYREATGAQDGDPWVQPQGAHDAYPEGSIVTHNGETWINLTPANVWEPGVSGWREFTEEEVGPAKWVQPSGAHDAYNVGDLVTFEGEVWESIIDGNIWSPFDNPEGWKNVGEPEVEEPVEEEPEVEEPIPDPDPETVPDFVQPTGGHDAYNTGDRVMFEGAVWESVIDGNTWSPTDNPTGWEQIEG